MSDSLAYSSFAAPGTHFGNHSHGAYRRLIHSMLLEDVVPTTSVEQTARDCVLEASTSDIVAVEEEFQGYRYKRIYMPVKVSPCVTPLFLRERSSFTVYIVLEDYPMGGNFCDAKTGLFLRTECMSLDLLDDLASDIDIPPHLRRFIDALHDRVKTLFMLRLAECYLATQRLELSLDHLRTTLKG
jgi:hypothetical protein